MLSEELIWCLKCGAYGNGKAIALRLPCTGDPKASWTDGKFTLNTTGRSINILLLKGGRHPDSRQPLPPAVPEHDWRSITSTIGIRTAITVRAAASKPKQDMLERIRHKEAAAKAHELKRKRQLDQSTNAPQQKDHTT